jgi:hypothetical protein
LGAGDEYKYVCIQDELEARVAQVPGSTYFEYNYKYSILPYSILRHTTPVHRPTEVRCKVDCRNEEKPFCVQY